MSVVAVIAGAGSGTRLGSQGPKALVLLGGEPLLVHAVRSMAQSGVIDACVVTAPADDVVTFREVLDRAGLDARVVAGGASRQASVAAGLDAAGDAEFVLIHDAARALTPVEQIRGVVAALRAGHPQISERAAVGFANEIVANLRANSEVHLRNPHTNRAGERGPLA